MRGLILDETSFGCLRSLLPALALLAFGCDADDDHHSNDDHGHGDHHDGADPCDDPRIDEFMVGTSVDGERVRVTIVDATPAEPFRGDNAWTVMLTDLSDAPLKDASLEVQPWMPDHGHGTSVGADVTERGEGELHVDPINLWMAGLWEVRFLVTLGDEPTPETVVLTVCVD